MNGCITTWRETTIDEPQRSVLGPLLFNIYLNDLSLFVNVAQICNYSDNTTLYDCSDSNIERVVKPLECDALEFGFRTIV